MLAKKLTYTDFNGNQQTEINHFNMSKTELTSLELDTDGGFSSYVLGILECRNDKNNRELVKLIKDILLMAYGQKSDDGKRFIKSEALTAEFEQTAYFDEYYNLLVTNESALIEFLKGIMPVMTAEQEKQIDSEVNKFLKERSDDTDSD